MNLQGKIYKFGDVWYKLTHMANIFWLSHLDDKHRITYYNW